MNDISEMTCFDKKISNQIDECIKKYPDKKDLGQEAKYICKIMRQGIDYKKKNLLHFVSLKTKTY